MTDLGHAPDHAVVVGGGIAGLTAAYRLTLAGSHVTLVEPDRLGGKIHTSVFAGRPIDEGADAFLLRVPWALALCHDLEIDGELISPVGRAAEVFVDDVRHPMPSGHVMGVPTDLDALTASGLLSSEGLARVAAEEVLPARPGDPLLVGPDHDVAIGPYLRGRLGDEVVDHLIDPLIGGINAGNTADLSLATVVPQLDAAARSGEPSLIRACRQQRARALAAPGANPDAPVFATPIGGMSRLVDALVALMPALDVRLGRRVDALVPHADEGGVTVVLDDGSSLSADAVVVACPAPAAATLLRPLVGHAADHLSSLGLASVTMATLAFDQADLRPDPTVSGCLVPRDQGTLATAISYGTSKWAQWQDPDRGDTILRVSAGRSDDRRHLDLDDVDLLAALADDLGRILGVTGAPTEVRVTRWFEGLPQYAPGHLDRMAELRTSLAHRPIALAGAFLGGVGVPACIRSGELAAAQLGATWRTRRELQG